MSASASPQAEAMRALVARALREPVGVAVRASDPKAFRRYFYQARKLLPGGTSLSCQLGHLRDENGIALLTIVRDSAAPEAPST